MRNLLTRLIDRHRADYVVVNVENSAGGFGVTPEVLAEIEDLPIDCYTTGNHVWDKKEGVALLGHEPRLLRPHNYPAGNPGRSPPRPPAHDASPATSEPRPDTRAR